MMTQTDDIAARWAAAGDRAVELVFEPLALSPRKTRLFAAALCRVAWPLLTDPRSRAGVEAAEAFADGRITARQRGPAVRAARDAYFDACEQSGGVVTGLPVRTALAARAVRGAVDARVNVVWAADAVIVAGHDDPNDQTAFPAAWAVQGELLATLVGPGYPFPAGWRSDTAVALARGIEAERAFDRMPILADALEEAGCDDPTILARLRGPGPFALGDWVLDGLLGKG